MSDETTALKKALNDLSEVTHRLINAANHFASEDRSAPIQSGELFFAIEDAHGEIAEVDKLIKESKP